MRVFSAFLILIVIMMSNANGQQLDSAMVFDYGYAATPSYWYACAPATGTPFWMVGTVRSFNAPFTDLLPPSGTYEATYVLEGLIHVFSGEHTSPDGCGSAFEGGGFRVYIDLTPDADPADAATYRDGELVLEASLQGYFVLDLGMWDYVCPHFGPTQLGSFIFTGGSWFSRVSNKSGQGYWAHNIGCFWDQFPETLRQMGYMGVSRSWMNVQAPISADASTWGKIKALYR